MSDYWDGKAAVVTGAARGQGAAEVVRLLAAGARVYAIDVKDLVDPSWNELRERTTAWPDHFILVRADVSVP